MSRTGSTFSGSRPTTPMHYPRCQPSFQSSVRLANDGAELEYYEKAERMLEHAHTEEQEWSILRKARQSPRFAEALVRQGLELEELGPRSFLAAERRAALLAAVLQEREELPQEEPLSASKKMSRALRERLTSHIQKMEDNHEHRRATYETARNLEEERRDSQIKLNKQINDRANRNLARRDQDRATKSRQLSNYGNYVEQVARWKRESDFEFSNSCSQKLQESVDRCNKHMERDKKKSEQRQEKRRSKSNEKEHQVMRVMRMQDHQSERHSTSIHEDDTIYKNECTQMLSAMRSMTDPRGMRTFMQRLDARDPRPGWQAAHEEEANLSPEAAEAHSEEAGSPTSTLSGSGVPSPTGRQFGLQEHLPQSPGSPGASGGGANGVRMLRSQKGGAAEELQLASVDEHREAPTLNPEVVGQLAACGMPVGQFPISPGADTLVDTELLTPTYNGTSHNATWDEAFSEPPAAPLESATAPCS